MPESATAPPPSAPSAPAAPLTAKDHSDFSDAFAELDKIDGIAPAEPPAPEVIKGPPPKPREEPSKKPTAAPKPKDTAPPKPTEPKAPEPKQDDVDDDPTVPHKSSELRPLYLKSKKTLQERDSEIARLRQELETAKTAPREDPERKTLAEKLTAAEKRAAEYEEHLKLVDYQKSEEFQTKFWKPYEKAMLSSLSELEGLAYTDEETGKEIPVTEDLIRALASEKPAMAAKRAKAMFGDLAEYVTSRITKIRDAAQTMQEAIVDQQKRAGEVEQTRTAAAKARHEEEVRHWQQGHETVRKKYPQWFGQVEGDDDANKALNTGMKLAAQAFQAFGDNGTMPAAEKAKLHVMLFNKAAGFDRAVLYNQRANAKIKELEAALAEYQKSEPPADSSSVPMADKGLSEGMEGAFAELDAIEKKSRAA